MKKIVIKILTIAGSDKKEAEIVASHLVQSNLLGHDSHGVGMVPIYVSNIANGALIPNQRLLKIKAEGAILVFDGQRGYGQRVAGEVMQDSIENCKQNGLTVSALRNAHHIGRVGAYGEQSLAAGLISIHFVNVVGTGRITPHAGRDGRLGTNPICIAIPGTKQTEPILLDMASSKLSMGKVRLALEEGVAVEDDNLLDPNGNPTNDPNVMYADPPGAMLPAGSYKGYGIALCCEVLAGVLCGGGTIQNRDAKSGGIINNMLTILVDPIRLVDAGWMHREIKSLIRHVKASPPVDPKIPVRIAGEPEREKHAQRKETGIPLSSGSWQALCKTAEKVGIARKRIEAMRDDT